MTAARSSQLDDREVLDPSHPGRRLAPLPARPGRPARPARPADRARPSRRSGSLPALRVVLVAATAAAAVAVGAVWATGPAAASLGRVTVAGTGFEIGVQLTRVSSLLVLLVAGIAALVVAFASRQYDPGPSSDRFAGATAALVLALGLTVTAASLPVLALGWTLAGVAAVALLAHRDDADARAAARRTAVRLAPSDLALWAAVVVAALVLDDLDLGALGAQVAAAPAAAVTAIALLLVAAGAVRSALVPTHRWLAETTTAPTPVSALLHAGFVNGLGVLVVLLWPIVAAAGAARALLVVGGVATILVTSAQRQARPDVKGRLVTSTSSQMGYLAVQAGIGVPAAALAHLLGHALYKASLFLGAGRALQHRAHPADVPPARPLVLGAAAVAATLALLVGLGAAPYPWPAAVVLLGVAGLAATLALATALAAPLPAGRRAGLGGAVLAALAATVLATAALDRALHEQLPVWTGWDAVTSSLAVAGLVATVATVAGVDRAVRAGRLGRLHAWAVRSALPPRASRWRPGAPVPAGPREPVTPARRAEVRVRAADAASALGATYPLTDFVASNPLAGLEHLPFTDAARRAAAVRDAAGFLPLDEYRRLAAAGEIVPSALVHAVERSPIAGDGAVVVAGRRVSATAAAATLLRTTPRSDLRRAVAGRLAPAAADAPAPADPGTLGELLDRALGTRIAATVDAESSAWVAAYADRGTMRWPLPAREAGLWSAWRATAAGPGADVALGAPGLAAAVAGLPARADEAVAVLLDALAVDPGAEVDELARSLGRLPGWTGHLQWAAGHHEGSGPLELLAIRLTLEWALAAAVVGARPELGTLAQARRRLAPSGGTDRAALVDDLAALATGAGRTPADVAAWSNADLLATVALVRRFDAAERAATWQRAYEETQRAGLLDDVARAVRDDAPRADRPDRQVVLCIDVRSEPLRRHLEARPGTETLGFAGFFGVPFAHLPFGAEEPRDQCPVLLRPRNEVADVPRDGAEGRRARVQLATVGASTDAGHRVEELPLAPLAFAEPAGWVLAAAAAVRTAAPVAAAEVRHRLVDRGRDIALRADVAAGFTLDERVFLAERALRTMGLTRRFGRLVLLCGHGSTTENNPFAAGYQCGACGGHDGAANARVAAAVLDDPEVRARLVEQGIAIPADTWFTPGRHDTATDRVTLLEPELVPDSHREDRRELERVLDEASRATAAERARRLPLDRRRPTGTVPAEVAARRAERRSRDWAEPRPEWGLAGNATFVAGPRRVTEQLDLQGRAFLHSYEAAEDADGTALETILTAPLVVAQWINSQYYFSAVDPEGYGAGDKVVHNVTAGLGVVSGPRGDLRVGLPRQALIDADGERVHRPLRLQALVVARPQLVAELVERHEVLTRLVGGGWIDLVVIDPAGGDVVRWPVAAAAAGTIPAAGDAVVDVTEVVHDDPTVLDEALASSHHGHAAEERVPT